MGNCHFIRLFLSIIILLITENSSSVVSKECGKDSCRSFAGIKACMDKHSYKSWSKLFKKHKKCKTSYAYVCGSNVPRSKGEPYAGCRNGPESLKACSYATSFSPKQLLSKSPTCSSYYERYLKIQADKANIEEEIDSLFDEIRNEEPQDLTPTKDALKTQINQEAYNLPDPLPLTPSSSSSTKRSSPPPATIKAPTVIRTAPTMPVPTATPVVSAYPAPYAYAPVYPYPVPYTKGQPQQQKKKKKSSKHKSNKGNPLFEKVGMDTIKTIGAAILAA